MNSAHCQICGRADNIHRSTGESVDRTHMFVPGTDVAPLPSSEGTVKSEQLKRPYHSFMHNAKTPHAPPVEHKMKTIDQTVHCQWCEGDFSPFTETSDHEIFIRKYVGQHGHLVTIGFHRDCLMQWVENGQIPSGSQPITAESSVPLKSETVPTERSSK